MIGLSGNLTTTAIHHKLFVMAKLYLLEPEQLERNIVNGWDELGGSLYLQEADMQEVQWEYQSLFMTPGSTRYLAPFESMQREGHIWGQSSFDVLRYYHAGRFDQFRMPASAYWKATSVPDHIGYELAFVGHLFEKVQDAATAGSDCSELDDMAQDFWQNHIVPWVGEYGCQLESQASLPFYKYLGNITTQLAGHSCIPVNFFKNARVSLV